MKNQVCPKHPDLSGERDKDGRCRPCRKNQIKIWRLANLDKVRGYDATRQRDSPERRKRHSATSTAWKKANPLKHRAWILKQNGFTPDLFDAAMRLQNAACAICHTDLCELPKTRIHPDHDHLTGIARGILCSKCNLRLGHFENNTAWLKAAVCYLAKPTLGVKISGCPIPKSETKGKE